MFLTPSEINNQLLTLVESGIESEREENSRKTPPAGCLRFFNDYASNELLIMVDVKVENVD